MELLEEGEEVGEEVGLGLHLRLEDGAELECLGPDLLVHAGVHEGVEALEEVVGGELGVVGDLAHVRAELDELQREQLHLGVLEQHESLAEDLDGHLGTSGVGVGGGMAYMSERELMRSATSFMSLPSVPCRESLVAASIADSIGLFI